MSARESQHRIGAGDTDVTVYLRSADADAADRGWRFRVEREDDDGLVYLKEEQVLPERLHSPHARRIVATRGELTLTAEDVGWLHQVTGELVQAMQADGVLEIPAGPAPARAISMQPIVDVNGVHRFRANAVVEYVMEHARALVAPNGQIDMCKLREWELTAEPPPADVDQFYQLIGYSVSGYGDLSQISRASADAAAVESARLVAATEAAASAIVVPVEPESFARRGNDIIARADPDLDPTTMLDDAAHALGWRTDFAGGDSPITWELVLNGIRERAHTADATKIRDRGLLQTEVTRLRAMLAELRPTYGERTYLVIMKRALSAILAATPLRQLSTETAVVVDGVLARVLAATLDPGERREAGDRCTTVDVSLRDVRRPR